MKRTLHAIAVAALFLAAPLAAQAVQGWVVEDISLQAGPDPAYPSITELAAGTPVSIQGCIEGWTWCDVLAGPDRGWVPGTFLEEDYGGQRVVVIDYGPQIAIPIVSFSLGVYWDQHYHNRPFYAQRQQWVARAITPSQPKRPTSIAARGSTQQRQMTTTTQQRQMTTTQQRQAQQLQAQQQQSKTTTRSMTTARATAPKRPESMPAPTPQATPQQVPEKSKTESSQQQTSVAKAKPRTGEPKPKDELKKPKQKDEHRDNGGER